MVLSNAYNYINVLDKAADASWTRNDVLANNIANADTPGYKRKDVQFANSSSVRALSSRRLIANARASLCSIVFSLEESLYAGIKFCLRKAFSSSYFGNLISP